MKIKSIFATALALLMFSACNKDEDGSSPDILDGAYAYLAINVVTEPTVRASDEDPGEGVESAIKKLYLFTFDASGNILQVPGTTDYYLTISGDITDAQRVNVNAKSLLVIANPGAQLFTRIGTVGTTITDYADLNEVINNISHTEVANPAETYKNGFTMINSGVEPATANTGDQITTPLIDIENHIKKIEDYPTVQQAQNAAQNHKVAVKIERLAAKVKFIKGSITVEPTTKNASFNFQGWLLDVVNTTCYPFAMKSILATGHLPSTGSSYKYNFYTQDPNFEPATAANGLDFVKVNASTGYKPQNPVGTDVTWMGDGNVAYRLENTVAATEQKYGNLTRMVIKGLYYPDDTYTEGDDWFSFAGTNYKDLAELKQAYVDAGSGSNLQAACDRMYDAISAYNPSVSGTNFSSLTVGDLASVAPVGGQIVKSEKDPNSGELLPCIRWYQGGLNYYYYEIEHDNEITGTMAFGKYGIVRNNYYSLKLTSVAGPGTPWYPDPNNPGPGDPDPTDPVDEDGGYLGIELEVAPWIIWERDFGI